MINQKKVDILVIGGGMAGTATTYYLSQNSNLKIALLERYQVGNDRSSSYGKSRMYRRMYSNEYLSDLQEKSCQEWRKIETKYQCQLLRENGLLFYGESWEDETVEGSIPGAKQVMLKKNIPFEELDANAMAKRWPIRPQSDFIGLFETTAGTVFSDQTLQVFKTASQQQNVNIYESDGVELLEVADSGKIIVKTKNKICLEADKLVLAVGGWSNDLLAHFNQHLDLEIWSMLWGYYRVAKEYRENYPQWFCFQQENMETGDGGLYYGFPCDDLDSGLIKVGIDWCPPEYRTQNMNNYHREPVAELVEFLDNFLRSAWIGIEEKVSFHCCPYTMTKDNLFILDKLPEFSNIFIFTGGSGQAFKFAPMIGKLLSELVLEKSLDFDISPLSISREAVGWKKI